MNGLGSSQTFSKYIDMVTLLLARKSWLVDRKPQVSNQSPLFRCRNYRHSRTLHNATYFQDIRHLSFPRKTRFLAQLPAAVSDRNSAASCGF